jgi:tyrosyl-tRNA synthetase
MIQNFIEELRWRGMLQDVMPETENQLQKEMTSGYVGFDPTADSLHIGNFMPIMLLKRFQLAGHKPIALVGGATGMIGDPSGKSSERNILSEEILRHNVACVKAQLERFLDFDCGENSAELVNNYDWYKEFNILQFLREAGKYLTVSYMMAKDSVKNRMETGISFTEFSYQLFQGYDFYWLYKHKNCKIQMGGSDQWGNITTGTELIRRKDAGEAFALTCPLVTKADGAKFGKSEQGNIWLDAEKTSPYKFYQFWLNVDDKDVSKLLRFFTLFEQAYIEELDMQLSQNPISVKKILAEDMTKRVHSEAELSKAQKASDLLFGKSTLEDFENTEEKILKEVFDGIPQKSFKRDEITQFANWIDLLNESQLIGNSKGEIRKLIQGNGLSINLQKVNVELANQKPDLSYIKDKYLLLKKGKNYSLVVIDES